MFDPTETTLTTPPRFKEHHERGVGKNGRAKEGETSDEKMSPGHGVAITL